MANLRDIRSRITSVKSTKQITSAMKMVAAAKLKKSQDRINFIRPYIEKMYGIIEDLSEHVTINSNTAYSEKREIKNVLIILITSNRGLCGAFNSNISRMAVKFIEEKYSNQLKSEESKTDFYCFGKKGYEFIKKNNFEIIENNNQIFDELSYENISNIANKLMLLFKEKQYDCIELIYNNFKVAGISVLKDEVYLPFLIDKEKPEFPAEHIFEPELEYIREMIIPDYLKTKLFSIFLDSIAAEHGARMTAMHQATDNATGLIKELTLEYNKARQAAITKEILEITSGAEALRSD